MSRNVQRITAAGGATVLLTGGLLAFSALPASADDSATCYANPMAAATPIGSSSGYTIYVKNDAILANSELEGTLAVGGDATFGDLRGFGAGQYPITQGGVGGSADYAVPTIDGQPSRVLLNRFTPNPSAPKVVQIKGSGPDAGGAKIVSPTPGYIFGQQFGGAGTTYFPSKGGNQSPQLESQVQPWNEGAGASTFATDRAAFADYFPADRGTSLLAQEGIWRTPQIVPGGETRIVLDPTGPNRVTLDQIDDAAKFRLEGYSATSPLIVAVTADDLVGGVLTLPSELDAGKNAPGNAALSYVLWDLSTLSGDVTVVSFNEPVRGAVYAPDAHVILPPERQGGKEFEGQLIAQDFTALNDGKELHTNLFLGKLPCVDDSGAGGGTKEPGTGGGTEEPGTGGRTEEPGTGAGTEEPGTGGRTEEPGTGGGTEEPGTEEPGTVQPGVEAPGTEQPTVTEPVGEQSAIASTDQTALAVTGGALPWAAGGAAVALAAAGGVLLWTSRRRAAR